MNRKAAGCAGLILLTALAGNLTVGVHGAAAASVTFTYTGGAQSFTVPAGVTSISVDVQGAAGGGGPGSSSRRATPSR